MLTLDRTWVIRKHGSFYRPNRCGYTDDIKHAGRYTEQEARAEARIEPSITAHPADEFELADLMQWRPMATAPKNGTEVLLRNKQSTYVGRWSRGDMRTGPQPEQWAWRASCCGRFTEPTEWRPI